VNLPNFFAELRRRNVYKVAIVYVIVAWLLIQAASILFPTFDAPAWTMKVFVTAIALGCPLAVMDPLRNDPRFQKILAGPEPKTIRK
jgi:hypothetical protein